MICILEFQPLCTVESVGDFYGVVAASCQPSVEPWIDNISNDFLAMLQEKSLEMLSIHGSTSKTGRWLFIPTNTCKRVHFAFAIWDRVSTSLQYFPCVSCRSCSTLHPRSNVSLPLALSSNSESSELLQKSFTHTCDRHLSRVRRWCVWRWI